MYVSITISNGNVNTGVTCKIMLVDTF